MSHKQAKKERKMNEQMVRQVITITSDRPGDCSISCPQNVQLTIWMLTEALRIIGSKVDFVQQSPIVQPPPGLKVN